MLALLPEDHLLLNTSVSPQPVMATVHVHLLQAPAEPAQQAAAPAAAAAAPAPAAAAAPPVSGPGLPPGWFEAMDPTYQHPYWCGLLPALQAVRPACCTLDSRGSGNL